MVKRVISSIDFEDTLMGVDLIKEVGIGGHFLQKRHTLDHFVLLRGSSIIPWL